MSKVLMMEPSARACPVHTPQIQWTRFWCPLGGPIDCGNDGRGFLANPEGEFFERKNPHIRRLESLIPEVGPLILCGDPGIGKTTELRRLKTSLATENENELVLALNFRQHISNIQEFRQRTIDSDAWKSWRTGTGRITLMVDGIDEGLIRIPTFISSLNGILEDEPVGRLRLILTCRSAEWPQAQGDRLLAMWQIANNQTRPIYELCPLRYVDVQLAVKTWNLDSEDFTEALIRAQAIGLATRPVTLLFLMEEFRDHGCFPATHRELYQRGTLKLAHEVDPERLEILRASRLSPGLTTTALRLRAAQRLALLLLCCGKRAIFRDEPGVLQSKANELTLSECATHGGSPSLIAFVEVLESALFTSVGHERFAFLHQTFAECLASIQLSELPLVQVRRLLMQRDESGEHVVPQLTEVAAWTAGNHNEFCCHLLRTDPTALLHCDASVLSEDLKRQLVDAILLDADQGRIVDDNAFYKFFHTLKHPGLAQQLRSTIATNSCSEEARGIAIEIANRCHLEELADDFLLIVADPKDALRRQAARACN